VALWEEQVLLSGKLADFRLRLADSFLFKFSPPFGLKFRRPLPPENGELKMENLEWLFEKIFARQTNSVRRRIFNNERKSRLDFNL
jgi:hypothetical protein